MMKKMNDINKYRLATKLIKIFDKIFSYATYIFLILFVLLGVYALYDNYAVGKSAELDDEILSVSPAKLSDEEFSIDSLKNINEDIVGWIKIDDTRIDYPIVQGEDNSDYLNANYKGEYATAGSIFLDYRNHSDFQDDYSIIYGHNMSAGHMFSDVKKYNNKQYFDNHKKGKLYTEKGIYEIEVILYSYINAFSNEAYNLLKLANGNNDFLLNYFYEKATIISDSNVSKDEKLILLSTCDSTGSIDRNVLLAKITLIKGTDGDEIINPNGESPLQRMEDETSTTTIPITTKEVEIKKVKKHISLWWVFIIIGIIIVIIIFTILFIIIIRKEKNKKDKK